MMTLEIDNYRSFLKERFEFSRVNILIGENSSGKSSLLKFLLALKQTFDAYNESNFKLSGSLTDLGNYEEVVYYRKKQRRISMTFEAKKEYFDYYLEFLKALLADMPLKGRQKTVDEIDKLRFSTTRITYSLSSKLDDHSTIKTVITNDLIGKVEIKQRKFDEEDILRTRTCDLLFDFDNLTDTIKDCACDKRGFQTLLELSLQKKCIDQYGKQGEMIFYKLAFLLIIQNFFFDEIDKIRFVNPIGTLPKRLYFKEDRSNNHRSMDIEKLINMFGNANINSKDYNTRIALLNKAVQQFGIAEEIQLVKDKQLPVLALNVKTKDFWSNLTDVGHGVSLQLPILFQAILSEYYTKKGQTLLIEQPEVHLHPRLQAKFIETLLSFGKKNTYFIETHSEHIIRKLQVMVKNGDFSLKPQDVTIHYFKRVEGQFSITSHSIGENGRLLPSFPEGFYDVSYSLVKQLL